MANWASAWENYTLAASGQKAGNFMEKLATTEAVDDGVEGEASVEKKMSNMWI